MFAWLAIVVAELALIGWQRWQLSELLRGAVPAEPAVLESLVAQCAVSVRLARPPRVLVTGDECSPFVCGAWRPAMVLPRSIVWKLSEAELRPVVVHELRASSGSIWCGVGSRNWRGSCTSSIR